MKIAIIDYNSGNLHSVFKAFHLVASKISPSNTSSNTPPNTSPSKLMSYVDSEDSGGKISVGNTKNIGGVDASINVEIVHSAKDIRLADVIVLPGVGSFADCRSGLASIDGAIEAIKEHITAGKGFFGICVGMQLLAEKGFEKQETAGLGVLNANIEPIRDYAELGGNYSIPHMGWNNISVNEANHNQYLLKGINTDGDTESDFYFVHSYFMKFADETSKKTMAKMDDAILAYSEYAGVKIPAIIAKNNLVATQFHPEKSGKLGILLIENFLKSCCQTHQICQT